jgi:hypothetical protein
VDSNLVVRHVETEESLFVISGLVCYIIKLKRPILRVPILYAIL